MTETKDLEERIAALDRKLDFVIEELAAQTRHRRAMEDLQQDLLMVGKDVYRSAVAELEGISDHVQPGDVVQLFKKLLRNTNSLARAFEQLESARDLLADLKPITKGVYLDALRVLEELDRKGYFEFARAAAGVLDKVVGAVSAEDLERAAESIPRLVRLLRVAGQPQILRALESLLARMGEAGEPPNGNASYFRLLKELGSPEAKHGFAVMLRLIKSMGAAGAPAAQAEAALVC